MIEIRKTSIGYVMHYKNSAKKEQSIISNTENTTWYGAYMGDALVGFTALMLHGQNKARFKATYVLKAYRGQGISKELNDYTLKIAKELNVDEIDAYTTPINKRWYEKNGFEHVRDKGDIAYMRLVLNEQPKEEKPKLQSKMFDLDAQKAAKPDKEYKPSDSGMSSYKGWTKEQRLESLKLTKLAIKNGEIPPPTKCNRCGQEKGIIQYHNEDYSHPTKYLEQLCWRCHMIHHSKSRNPKACADYWQEVRRGKQYPPVFRHDFKILANEHGIF